MDNISRAIKAKVKNFTEEDLILAENECEKARACIAKAIQSSDSKNSLLEAVEYYLKAINFYSGLTEPYLAIANICWQFGQSDEAIGLLNKVLDSEPFNLNAIWMLNKIKNEASIEQISKKAVDQANKSLSERTVLKAKVNKHVIESFQETTNWLNDKNETTHDNQVIQFKFPDKKS